MIKKYIGFFVLGSLFLSACATVIQATTNESPSSETSAELATSKFMSDNSQTETGAIDDSIVLLAEEEPPLLANSEFSTDFSRHTVPYSEFLTGGPPKDGIPAIDSPRFIDVERADLWLRPEEPVIAVIAGETAKAYPTQVLLWHEIVNDTVGELDLSVTFCPLCNTGIAYIRQFDGRRLDFGATGLLRFSNLVMYDRQTETWWQQATGEGIVGEYAGRQLEFYPTTMISWEEFKNTFPNGQVLSRDTGFERSYGTNPYPGYDNINRSPGLYRGPETPGILPAMARILTVDFDTEAVAYPFDVLQDLRVVNDRVADNQIVVFWQPGTASALGPSLSSPWSQPPGNIEWEPETASALDALTATDNGDVGSATAFIREAEGQPLTFIWNEEKILDDQTGSEWNVLGQAIDGPLAGTQLKPVVAINHFWFSWAAFKPDTRIYQP
jgi:hypothetical protein